jgi:hypothetical protein
VKLPAKLQNLQKTLSLEKKSKSAKLELFRIYLNMEHPGKDDILKQIKDVISETLGNPRNGISALLGKSLFSTRGMKRKCDSINLQIDVGGGYVRTLHKLLVAALKLKLNLIDDSPGNHYGTEVACLQIQGCGGAPVMAIHPFSEVIDVPLVWKNATDSDMNLFDNFAKDRDLEEYCKELMGNTLFFCELLIYRGKKYYFSLGGHGSEKPLGII